MILHGGLVLRPDGSAEQLDVRIEDGRIAGVGSSADWADSEILDSRNRLIAPGLINTHCHSNENYFKGCFDNMPLEIWMLFSYPILAAPRQSAREIYIRTMLGCIEMLKTGCTTVVAWTVPSPLLMRHSSRSLPVKGQSTRG